MIASLAAKQTIEATMKSPPRILSDMVQPLRRPT
jgi:hypothetical protein